MTGTTIEHPPGLVGAADDAEPLGLRERKKAKTRAAIREQGLRLFRSQGYHATTIEQIAAAADISPATFFRYFPTKEDLVLRDGLDLVALSAFEAQSPELGPIGAYRAAVAATLAGLTPADLDAFADSSAFKLTIPEVRARAIDELARTIDTLAIAIAGRLARVGRDADDVAIRSTAGAIVGVVIAATLPWREGVRCGDASLDFRSIFERIDEGLRCLEAGLPLG